jgi:uracil-DNA glycosylase family 4
MYRTRAEKLTALQAYMDLETGTVKEETFQWENDLFDKSVKKKSLDAQVAKCQKCPGMNVKRYTEAVPGWGNLNADVFFLGQSLHKPGVVSGLPFIKGGGYLCDAALRLSGLLRKDVYFWNCVLCHPERNRASTEREKENCRWYLWQAVYIVQPKLIVAMGNDAKEAVATLPSLHIADTKIFTCKHPASFMYAEPESRYTWVVKLSLEMDKVIGEVDG